MKTIRLIIEAEVDESAIIGPEVIKRAWGDKPRSEEWMDGIRHEQAMLTALLNNPKQRRENLIAMLVSEIQGLKWEKAYEMTDLPTEYSATYRSLIDSLPPESAKFFREMDELGLLSENTDLVDYAVRMEIKKIDFEQL